MSSDPRSLSPPQALSINHSAGNASSRSVPLGFKLYGDSTIHHEGGGQGVLVSLGPYQLLFDCGAAAAQSLCGPSSELLPSPAASLGKPESTQTQFLTEASQHEIKRPGLAMPPVDFVFCSHAHADHAQGLLSLHRAWPRLPVFASQATAQLLSLNWPTNEVPNFCQGLPWREPLRLMDDLTVELFPAGHLLGAAVMVISYAPQALSETGAAEQTVRVAYLGDCFLSATRCSPGLDLDSLRGLKPELLITEGTYGVERFPRRRQQENALVEQVLRTLGQERFVLMPVSSLGIAQEVMVLLRSHHLCTGRDFEIWVDEPIAQACDRYLELLGEMPSATQNFAQNQSLFWDNRVLPHVRRFESPNLDIAARPSLVLVHTESDWGQLIRRTGHGSWELWLDRTDELSSNASGWAKHPVFAAQSDQSLNSLKASLQTGELQLNSYQLTDHCDGLGTTQLIHNLRPQHVLLVHGGNDKALKALSDLEELRSRYDVHVAEPEVAVSLSLRESLTPPPIPKQHYSGELQEDNQGIQIQLPKEITQAPHWQALAETGLLEAEWQGDTLLIRGLSPKQLLSDSHHKGSSFRRPTDCCKVCFFYREQYCCNPDSLLASSQVLAESYCDEFQRLGN